MDLSKLRKPVLDRLERLRTQWRTFAALPRSVLEQVSRGTPWLIHICVAGLDMAAALEEISEAAGDLETPEGRFRHLFVQMSRALGAGSLRLAE